MNFDPRLTDTQLPTLVASARALCNCDPTKVELFVSAINFAFSCGIRGGLAIAQETLRNMGQPK